MRNELQRQNILNLKSQGKTFNEIAEIMRMSSNAIIIIYYYERKVLPKKRGPHFSISNYHKLRMLDVASHLHGLAFFNLTRNQQRQLITIKFIQNKLN